MLERWQSLFPIWLSVLLFASFGLGWLSNGFEYSSIWYLLIGCILLWYGGYRLRGTAEEAGELTDGVQTALLKSYRSNSCPAGIAVR